jgi:futalosine hydrolase
VILVVCAMREELRDFVPSEHVRVIDVGVGPVEAAVTTARTLASAPFAAVVNAGIAGVFRGRGAVGDAFAVASEALADFGLEGGAPLALPGGARLVDRVDADAGLVARCAAAGLRIGRGLTVAQVTTTDATAARLERRYDADVESMEGFAVLRAAADAGIPAVEVRGISNYVGDRARSEWDFGAGARATVRALGAIVTSLMIDHGRSGGYLEEPR